jgi:hypothetical protein
MPPLPAPPAIVTEARTWAEITAEFLNEQNFFLTAACGPPLPDLLQALPGARAIVDVLRRDPATRIKTGAPRLSLDTGEGDEALAFADAFRAAPLEQALRTPFALAHFGLEVFDVPGGLLDGLRARFIEPWADSLRRNGFSFHRCYPILFISNAGGKPVETSYHMDKSHVVACQIYGRKRWVWLKEPSKWADRETRLTHVPGQLRRPEALSESDLVSVDMGPGEVLFNKLLTPHWVQAVGDDVAVSLNLSHGGLRCHGRLTRNEAELRSHEIQLQEASAARGGLNHKPAWEGLPGQYVLGQHLGPKL